MPDPFRFAKRSIYNMKRRFGAPADLYHIVSITDDTETGVSIVNKVKYKINRVILLPTTLNREMNISGAYKRPSPNLPSNEIDLESRFIIIDKEDLPSGLELGSDDYIIVHERVNRIIQPGKRFNIQRIQELEDNISVLIIARYMKGGQRNEIFDELIKERIIINEGLINS